MCVCHSLLCDMGDKDLFYHRVAWDEFNAHQRDIIGLPGYLEDVAVEGIEFPIYSSLLTDSGFVVIQDAVASIGDNPRNRLVKDDTEASLGRLTMNYGFSLLLGEINDLVLRFQNSGDASERTDIGRLITELCLRPLLDEDNPILPPQNAPGTMPDRKDMKQTANAIIQSPLFPVEFFVSMRAKSAILKNAYSQIDGNVVFPGDGVKFLASQMMKKGVATLAFSVFTVLFRYSELMFAYAPAFTYESSTDRLGSTIHKSPFGAGIRRGIGTNLGRGGVDPASLDSVVDLSTFRLFVSESPYLIAQLSHAIPSYLRSSSAASALIEVSFNDAATKRTEHSSLVRDFLRSHDANEARLAVNCDSAITERVFIGDFLDFCRGLENVTR